VTEYAAHVFDLDGVVRDFTAGDATLSIEAALGLPRGHVAATAFRPDLLEPTITGRQTFEHWYAAICVALESDVTHPHLVQEHMAAWRDHRGAPIASTVAQLEGLRSSGARTFVFTNGTDTIPDELRLLGLDHLFDGLLNSAALGVAKPDPAAYAAAHAAIEDHLGRRVQRHRVWFTDDRPVNVEAAREFGWDAELFVGPD
jgi:putative hydrolase of the HAD superfamily